MTPRITLAVATRVLTQLRRDHRTLALLLVMPCVILALLWWMFGSSPAHGAGFDALGLFVSAFARTEFQAVQFMPAVVIPQILLCGLFVARDDMPRVLGAISDVLPLSYAVDAMTAVSRTTGTGFGGVDASVWSDLAVVVGFALASLALGAATLRRRTA
jgi:ABC-type multidrug transport system permease subunit